MNLITLLGFIGIGIGVTRAMPQLVTLLRAREAFGVSVDSAATSSLVSLGWATYGAWTHQPYIIFSSGATGFIFLLITLFALRYGRKVSEFKVAPLWLGTLILSGGVFRTTGLGVVMPVSSLASNVPQIWTAHKERNLADLSLGTWLIAFTEGMVWGCYALLQRDVSIGISSIFQTLTAGTIVVLKIQHKNNAG